MKTLFLEFANEEEAQAAMEPFVESGLVIDVVGVIHAPTGRLVETEGGQMSETAPLPGWHVNVLAGELPEALQPYEVFPETPTRVFALEPEPLRVPQEVTMAQCRLALHDLHGIDIEEDAEFFALVDVLPENQRARARFELRTRATVQLDNLLVDAICAAESWDKQELFIYAAAL